MRFTYPCAHRAAGCGPAAGSAGTPLKQIARKLLDGFDRKVFEALYSGSLVCNTCREERAADREALRLRAEDRMLVITSAGCNALDCALPYCLHIGRKAANADG
jgi:S-adenosylmethionine-diacylglycerol 3-amino-3-carboxypropyl transferase